MNTASRRGTPRLLFFYSSSLSSSSSSSSCYYYISSSVSSSLLKTFLRRYSSKIHSSFLTRRVNRGKSNNSSHEVLETPTVSSQVPNSEIMLYECKKMPRPILFQRIITGLFIVVLTTFSAIWWSNQLSIDRATDRELKILLNAAINPDPNTTPGSVQVNSGLLKAVQERKKVKEASKIRAETLQIIWVLSSVGLVMLSVFLMNIVAGKSVKKLVLLPEGRKLSIVNWRKRSRDVDINAVHAVNRSKEGVVFMKVKPDRLHYQIHPNGQVYQKEILEKILNQQPIVYRS